MSFELPKAFKKRQDEDGVPGAQHPRPIDLMFNRCASALLLAMSLSGCSSIPTPMEMAGKALETVGLKKPEPPDLADIKLPPRRIDVKLSASRSLNTDAQGQSSALVVRVYKLNNADTFKLVPFKDFGNVQRERDLMGDALLEARDVQLVPGQQLQWIEKVPRNVAFVGVVALFHSPASQRWRYLFDAPPLEVSGLSLGAHACTMSVAVGKQTGTEVAGQDLQFGAPTCK